jgi:parallel beta-helix repeat protein
MLQRQKQIMSDKRAPEAVSEMVERLRRNLRENMLRIGRRIMRFGFVATVLILTFQTFSHAQNGSSANSPPAAVPSRNPLVPPFLAPIYSEVIPISSGFTYNPAYDNLETFVAPNGRTVKVLVKGPEGGGTYTRAINSGETADAYFPAIVSEAIAAGAHEVVIPEATYTFQPPNAINPATGETWAQCYFNNDTPFNCPPHWTIGPYPTTSFTVPSGIVDLDIDLSGSTLNFNSPGLGIEILNAARVRLKHFTIDWPNLPIASLGTIVADPDNPGHNALVIDSRYPVTSPYYPGGNIQIQAVDPWNDSKSVPPPGVYSANLSVEEYFTFPSLSQVAQPTYVGRTSAGAQTYSCKSCDFTNVINQGQPCSFFDGCANFDPFSVGERVLVRHYSYLNGAAIELVFTEDIDLENFTILTGPTDGVDTLANGGLRGLRIDKGNIVRGPGRLITVPSGALGIDQDDFQLENSVIGFGGDDLLNISPTRWGINSIVPGSNGSTVVTFPGNCQPSIHNDPVVGDYLAFYDANFIYLGSARVVSETNNCNTNGTISATLNLQRSISAAVALIDLTDSDSARYFIKGNVFEYNRQHGILEDSSYGLIDSNTFTYNTSGAMIFADVTNGIPGPGAGNVAISNNEISLSPSSPYNNVLGAITILGLDSNSNVIRSPLFQKVVLSGNSISNVTSAAIAFSSTQYVAVESSTVTNSNESKYNSWGNLFSPLSPDDSILIYGSSTGEVCASTIKGGSSGPIGVSSKVDKNISVEPSCSE